MSISTRRKDCQEFLSVFHTWYENVQAQVRQRTAFPTNPLKLRLQPEELALLACLWKTTGEQKVILLDQPLAKCQPFPTNIQKFAASLVPGEQWHLVSNPLSEQEQEAQIVTDLSRALHALLSNQLHHNFILGAAKIDELIIPHPGKYREQVLLFAVGELRSLQTVVAELTHRGYIRHSATLEDSSFRVRGEQVDIRHPLIEGHVTLTFYGNSLETITQTIAGRTTAQTRLTVPPASFPAETVPASAVLSESLLFRPQHIKSITSHHLIVTDALETDIALPFKTEPNIHEPALKNRTWYVFYQNRERVEEHVKKSLSASARFCKSPLADVPLAFSSANHVVASEQALFPPDLVIKPVSREHAFELIGALEEGKPAVHADHGIGIYEGLERRTLEAMEREYLVLRYAAGDSLSVPVEYAHKVTPYISETPPKISRLGGVAWIKAKKKAQADAAAFASELLGIARRRSAQTRPPYHIDEALETELAKTFEYELTSDQVRTWQEVRTDLESDQPVDRLVVGDVGFGKTEIAIRAARHVIHNGKQVAVLAPTTLLVQQHFDTFARRLPDLAATIRLLSRFATPRQQRQVRQAITNGECRLAIGTHALLSKNIDWQNLGLVIIDEEQQFGVKQKEHFKKLRAHIDILSLSATPIPRTLSMALSGLRQLSVITTPPAGRKSVITKVGKLHETTIQHALQQELGRGGQVYIVAPKIRQLGTIKTTIQALAPGARLAVAHGRMPERNLQAIMHQFDQGEIDILVSSSIVENGLDLPNANTLIVWSATHFGLAGLYQLRGRIGRRDRQGYAYFFYNQAELTSIQRRRLTALTEASRLGAGWLIARRDLEIRGAGNLLGAQQSGSVNAVGVQLYLDMVNQVIDKADTELDVDIQLPLATLLPIDYIADPDERLRWYQRLSRAHTITQLDERAKTMQEKYGAPPAGAAQLILQLKLQHAAARAGISKISSKQISPPDEDPYWRLEVHGQDLPALLGKLHPLGNWAAKDNILTLDVDSISADLIKQLIKHLIK